MNQHGHYVNIHIPTKVLLNHLSSQNNPIVQLYLLELLATMAFQRKAKILTEKNGVLEMVTE